jgi:superfamily II DNA helicase RecQ
MQSIRTRSTGKLYAELYPGNKIGRDNFEEILGAMARAELLNFAHAVFEKEGKQIPYRTVSLSPTGRATNEATPVLFVMKDAALPASKRKPSKKSGKSKGSRAAAARAQSGTKERAASVSGSDQQRIEQALRAWRLSEAKRRRVPAFRIFGDRALLSIATTAPRNEAELLAVQEGIGAGIVKKYGAHIFRLIAAR